MRAAPQPAPPSPGAARSPAQAAARAPPGTRPILQGTSGPPFSELPAERVGLPARLLALVEAVGVGSAEARVELEMIRSGSPCPILGRVEQRLPDALRAPVGVDGELLDPAAAPEADRVEVDV